MAHSGGLFFAEAQGAESRFSKGLCLAFLLFVSTVLIGVMPTDAQAKKYSQKRASRHTTSRYKQQRVSYRSTRHNTYRPEKTESLKTAVVHEELATSTTELESCQSEVAFYMPVAGGRVSSEFGVRRRRHNHKGLDIAAPNGTPIEASAAGRVIFSGWCRGYGNTIVIEHAEGLTTRYAHATELFAVEGELVQQGQLIATVGSTGRSTGAHLHFEVMKNGCHLDPSRMVSEELASENRLKKENESNREQQNGEELIRATYTPSIHSINR